MQSERQLTLIQVGTISVNSVFLVMMCLCMCRLFLFLGETITKRMHKNSHRNMTEVHEMFK